MRITKEGIELKGFGSDVLVWLWWWIRIDGVTWSSRQHGTFHLYAAYWKYVGGLEATFRTPTQKIKGYSYEDLMLDWASARLMFGFYVVLYDVNTQRKPSSYWQAMGLSERAAFNKDVILLTCKDLKEVKEICDSISTDFAQAMGIRSGTVVYRNQDHRRI